MNIDYIQFSLKQIISYKNKYKDIPNIDSKFLIKKNAVFINKKEIKHNINNPWISTIEKKAKYMNNAEYLKNVNYIEEAKSQLTGLLNKLSSNNFNIIVREILVIKIETRECLSQLTDILYKKCLTEVNFIKLYVDVIKILMNKWPTFVNDNVKTTFITLLINKCHKTFLQWKTCENDIKLKTECINNLYLIGYLYNVQIIGYKIQSECINTLINADNENLEIGIELLCKFLQIMGKNSDMANKQYIDTIFVKLSNINNISSKNKFNILNLIDFRNNNWNNDINIKYNNQQKIKQNNREKEESGKREDKEEKEEKEEKDKIIIDINNIDNKLNTILLEYLDILDIDEVKEYYINYKKEDKEKLLCNTIIKLYLDEIKENKIYLIELFDYLKKNNYISNNYINYIITNIKENINLYQIDYPNIIYDIQILM
jgi:hypothetical protein